MLFENAHFYTPIGYKESLLCENGVIKKIGQKKEFEGYKGPRLSLDHHYVYPGFIESHGHLCNMGRLSQEINLTGLTSQEEVYKKLEGHPGDIIIGRGWDNNLWGEGFPNHAELTKMFPHKIVILTRVDGHAAWVNQKVLDEITHSIVEGGEIVKKNGKATGILIDNAMQLLSPWLEISHKRRKSAILAGIEQCLENGITSFHDAFIDDATLEALKEILAEGNLTVRVYGLYDGMKNTSITPQTHPYLSIRAVKLFSDGALGPCSAHLSKPYEGKDHCGLSLLSDKELGERIEFWNAKGFQICTHAIGDFANHKVLNAYEQYLGKNNPLRPRIEHAELLNPQDVKRFSSLGVVASIQATHVPSDARWLEKVLGTSRAETLCGPWSALQESGAIIANGSDAPIENISPIIGLYATTTRKNFKDDKVIGAAYALDMKSALGTYTTGAAYASFDENVKGSLEVGKYADMVVLPKDIMRVNADELREQKVRNVIIGGEIKYSRTGKFINVS